MAPDQSTRGCSLTIATDAGSDAAFQVVFGNPDDDEDDDDYVEDEEDEDEDEEGDDGDQGNGTAQDQSDAAMRIMGLLRGTYGSRLTHRLLC